jgi:hypothetical protein
MTLDLAEGNAVFGYAPTKSPTLPPTPQPTYMPTVEVTADDLMPTLPAGLEGVKSTV